METDPFCCSHAWNREPVQNISALHFQDATDPTFSSIRIANEEFQTREAPYVTALTEMLEGRFEAMKKLSSSASAPPDEWLTCKVFQVWDAHNRSKVSIYMPALHSAPLKAINDLTSVRISSAANACSLRNPSWTRTTEETPGKRVESRFSIKMLRSVRSATLWTSEWEEVGTVLIIGEVPSRIRSTKDSSHTWRGFVPSWATTTVFCDGQWST